MKGFGPSSGEGVGRSEGAFIPSAERKTRLRRVMKEGQHLHHLSRTRGGGHPP